MTYSASSYGKAFAAVASEYGAKEFDAALERFLALVKKNGDWSRRKEIIAACEAEVRARKGKKLLIVESARELTAEHKESITKAFDAGQYDFAYRIDPSLIGGVRLTQGGVEQMDASLQTIVQTIFNRS